MLTVALLQSSNAVGAVNEGVAVQSIVVGKGGSSIVGACVSIAMIVCVAVAL